jgi:hypothetical protein
MEDNKKLVNILMKNLNSQEKLDVKYINREREYNKRLSIKANKKHILDTIEIYQDICSLEGEALIAFEKETGTKKNELLSGLEKIYSYQLNFFKKCGVNISKYPKNLEDLMK